MGTLNEIRDLVRFNLDNRSDLTDARVDGWINQTLLHVSKPEVYRHPQLETTELVTMVAGTSTYALANTRTRFVEGVRNTRALQGYQLLKKNKRWLRERVQDTLGRPSHYTTFGTLGVENNIQVWPTPDASWTDDLEVEEYLVPVLLTGDADPSPFSDDWDEILIAGGTWRGFRDLQKFVTADSYRETYANLVNELVGRDKLEALSDPIEYDLRTGAARARTQRRI